MTTTVTRPLSKQPIPDHAKRVFQGILFEVYQWDQPLFDGTTQTFEKLKRPDTVLIIAVTEDHKIIIITEQQPGKSPFVGLPGGRVEEGEEVEAAVIRELREETGYQVKELQLLDNIQPISKIDWAVYTYVATGCTKFRGSQVDAGERITQQLVDFDQFVEIASQDTFADIELTLKILRAKLNPKKMIELKELLMNS